MGRLLPLLACGAICALLLEPCLLGGRVLAGGDLLIHAYPRYGLLGEAFARGELPRWNPWVYHGASWFGPRAGGVLYPIHALFACLPLAPALAAFVALHLWIGATGARALGGELGLGARAGWTVGLCYGLGGFLTSMHHVPPFLVSGAWLPWALAAAARVERRPGGAAAGLGLALGMILLATEPQGALAAALGSLLVAGLTAEHTRGRALLTACAGITLGGLLAGVQVLSILSELPTLDRALTTFEDARWGFSLGLLPELLVGGALGDRAPELSSAYWGYALWGGRTPWSGLSIGAAGLCLALTGCSRPSPARRLGLSLVALGILLAAAGAGQGLGLRFPAKWLVLTALGLALLAGAGAAALLREVPGARRIAWGACCALGLSAFLGLVAARSPAAADWLEGWDEAGRVQGHAAQAALSLALGRALLSATLLGVALRASATPRLRAVLILALVTGELVHLGSPSFRHLPASALERPALAQVVLDASPGPGPPRLDSNEAIQGGRASSRPGLSPGVAAQLACVELLLPDVVIRHGIRSILAFETVRPGELERLRLDPRLGALSLAERAARIDAALFVVPADGWVRLPADERAAFEVLARYELYQPPRLLVRPRAHPPWTYLATEALVTPSLEAARAATLAPGRDPRRLVVLGPEGAPVDDVPAAVDPGAAAGEVRLESFEPERVVLRVRSASPAWLVVRDAYATTWEATLDGSPTPIVRADVLFRAVRVPAGTHLIAFEHAPGWWWPGWLCALLGALGIAAAARRGRGPRGGEA